VVTDRLAARHSKQWPKVYHVAAVFSDRRSLSRACAPASWLSPSSAPALVDCHAEALVPELTEEAAAIAESSLPAVTVSQLLPSLAQHCLGARL
jgi:hypothetical protein